MQDHPERERPQVPNHVRSIAVQSLDALLRIEEQLITLNARLPLTPEETLAQLVDAEQAAKAEEPTDEKPVGRRKRI
jgi:hypothetical protein